MDVPAEKTNPVNELLDTPELAQAIESEQFKHLLDHVPVAILIGRIKGLVERIVYANLAFRRLTGRDPSDVEGRSWDVLDDVRCEDDPAIGLGSAVLSFEDFAGTFRMRGESDRLVQAYANVVEDEDGEPKFRLVALVDVTEHDAAQREDLQRQVRERDTLLKELQHRVKNNLALITALIRLEARQAGDLATTAHLDRLVGRIEALALLYQQLSADAQPAEVDLGAYLSQIAAAIMRSHASEAVRLNMQVDACPMSINIAMPVGLIVNEAMTNALKHAFEDRAGGTVTLACRRTDAGCDVTVEDDGVGLPPGTEWPSPGKLGTLVVQSLRENARAELRVWSEPGEGTRVTISIDDPARGRPQ
jgi:two-component sensor histidine kinase